MKNRFYSNGKLLLTGEYAILDGALSLALPTQFGQSLIIREIDSPHLIWKSLDEKGHVWFETTFAYEHLFTNLKDLQVRRAKITELSTEETLIMILCEAKKLNPEFLIGVKGFEIETKLTFSRTWGLGSSSTLINNVAQWAKIDAYKLLWSTFSGSGYDIACAQHNTALLYQLSQGIPRVRPFEFDPPFKDSFYFVYLNKKQNSREGISRYRNRQFDRSHLIHRVSEITKQMVACNDLTTFEGLIEKHEILISKAIDLPMVKDALFADYPGTVKSLGAWGGDFVLASGSRNAMEYFKKKGYETIIPYSEMILGA